MRRPSPAVVMKKAKDSIFNHFRQLLKQKQTQSKQPHQSASSASLSELSTSDRPSSVHLPRSSPLNHSRSATTGRACSFDDGTRPIINETSTSDKSNPNLHVTGAASPAPVDNIPGDPLVLVPCIPKEPKKYPKFKRLPVHSPKKGDELRVLNYSYVMGESTSLQEAVSITCDLLDLAEVPFYLVADLSGL